MRMMYFEKRTSLLCSWTEMFLFSVWKGLMFLMWILRYKHFSQMFSWQTKFKTLIIVKSDECMRGKKGSLKLNYLQHEV